MNLSPKLTIMAAKFSLSIINPSYESQKNAARLLHFMAAAFISINAVHQLKSHDGDMLICYTELVIAADIFILVFFGAGILYALPKVGVIFRAIESLVFLGNCIKLNDQSHSYLAILNGFIAAIYLLIAYREWRISISEEIEIKPTGITIPNFVANAEISWMHVKKVVADYNSILIETAKNKKVKFELRNNLKIEELVQINEFCTSHAQFSS